MGKRLVPEGNHTEGSSTYSSENPKGGCSRRVCRRRESLLYELFNLLKLDSYFRHLALVDDVISDFGLGVYFGSLDVTRNDSIT